MALCWPLRQEPSQLRSSVTLEGDRHHRPIRMDRQAHHVAILGRPQHDRHELTLDQPQLALTVAILGCPGRRRHVGADVQESAGQAVAILGHPGERPSLWLAWVRRYGVGSMPRCGW